MLPESRTFQLVRHSDSANRSECTIEVEVNFQIPAMSQLIYRVSGDVHSLAIPAPASPARKNELWRHTSFEIFLTGLNGAYYEFNFSPSTQWAAYRFDAYRQGLTKLQLPSAPRINTGVTPDSLFLYAVVDLRKLLDKDIGSRTRMAFAAVVENRDGDLSYWALRHTAGRPDFHHADGFAFELPHNDLSL